MDFVTPVGFRDIMPDEALRREEISQGVQSCFAARGYQPIETPTLERMDVMQESGDMSQAPFRLFDSQGDLLALRPDVTQQVARICAMRLRSSQDTFKFRYTQRVFRDAPGQAASREFTQIGIENIGESGAKADAEVIGLLADALKLAGLNDFKIVVGTVGVLRALLETCPIDGSWKNRVLAAYHASDFVELAQLCDQDGVPSAFASAIVALPRIRGGREAIEAARNLAEPLGCAAGLDDLAATFDMLVKEGMEDTLMIDFSIMSSFNYYTGVVFEAYSPYLGVSLGSGGRYDSTLAGPDGTTRPAAGFAFYLEHAMAAQEAAEDAKQDRPLRIAVPKGSLNPGTIEVLTKAGLDTTGLEDPGRQLIISNPGVDYIIVRPTDAPAFVSLGAADCGICGMDSLMEANPDVVELVDLQFGGCKFVVAEPQGATASVEERYRKLGSMRIATKYPRITRTHFDKKGMQVEIVKLHGNIELAPLTGLAERIVDITATGTTLRENNLTIVEDVISSTARFFANVSSFRTDDRVVRLAEALNETVKEQA